MCLHLFMLTRPTLAFKSFSGELLTAPDTFGLPIKIGNDKDEYITFEETFYIVNTTSRQNVIMSHPWQYDIGAILSTL